MRPREAQVAQLINGRTGTPPKGPLQWRGLTRLRESAHAVNCMTGGDRSKALQECWDRSELLSAFGNTVTRLQGIHS